MQKNTISPILLLRHKHRAKIKKVGTCLAAMFLLMATLLFWHPTTIQAQGDRPLAPEIVGGVTVQPGEYPWQVWFEFKVTRDIYTCGASLIHPKWVLTAGHCIGEVSEVVLGVHQINSLSETNRQTISVERIILHPNYDNYSLNNDIALIELTEPAQLNQWVTTIPLVTSPADDSLYEAGIESTVTGWGATSDGGSGSNVLREVNLPIVSYSTCRGVYGNELTRNMLCAGFADGGKDACQGDSGGPMVVPDNNGGWKQAGIVSWGDGCAKPGAYGVYTRLSNYEDWIAQYVNLSESNATPTATPTETETPVGTPVPPTETPVSPVAGVIMNGDFEQGANGDWTETSRQDYVLVSDELLDGINAQSGGYVAWLGGANNEVSNLIQSIQLPDGIISLNFAYQILSEDNCRRDRAYVRNTGNWVNETLSLNDYAGERVTLRFHVYTNRLRQSSFFVDDVTVTGSETTEPPSVSDIANGNLELGPNGDWTEYSKIGGNVPGAAIVLHTESISSELATGGDYVVQLGWYHREVGRLRQNIQVPDHGVVYLTYDYEIQSNERRCRRDRARVIVDGKRLHQHNLCRKNSDGWQRQSLDLSEFAGQTVRLDFWAKTNRSHRSSFLVDNIQFTSTRSARSRAAAPHDFVFLPLIIAE